MSPTTFFVRGETRPAGSPGERDPALTARTRTTTKANPGALRRTDRPRRQLRVRRESRRSDRTRRNPTHSREPSNTWVAARPLERCARPLRAGLRSVGFAAFLVRRPGPRPAALP